MKKLLCVFLALVMLLTVLSACGPKKTLHCDHCGNAVEVDADSNMEEDWIIYCGPCDQELFGGTLVQ